MKTVAFVPIKLNSERLPLKNIKSFRNGKPLIYYILNTLKNVSELDAIYVYCSSDDICDYLPKEIDYIKRDPYYDLSSTGFNEVLYSFSKIIDAETYVLAHATAPFMSVQSIETGIRKVNCEGYDSAFTVKEIQEFMWKEGHPFNYDPHTIPRTQDLDKISIETCGLYVYKKSLIMNEGVRIGSKPYLIPVSQIEAIDINTEEDFEIANAIFYYKTLFANKEKQIVQNEKEKNYGKD